MLLAHAATGFVAGLFLRWSALVLLAPVLVIDATVLVLAFEFALLEAVAAIVLFQFSFAAGAGARCLVRRNPDCKG